MVKNPPSNAGDVKRCRFDTWVGKIPWRRKWQPTPVFLLGKSHGQRSLVGYSPQGRRRVGHDLATKQQQKILKDNLKFYLPSNLERQMLSMLLLSKKLRF